MFAGERSSIPNYQVSCVLDELAVFANTRLGQQIEIQTHVNTAVTKVAIKGASVLVSIHQVSKITQVRSQLLRCNRSIVPALPVERNSRRKCRRARPRL